MVVFAVAVRVVDAVVGVPDTVAVYLAGVGYRVPVESRPAVALVDLNEGVGRGVGDGAALDLAAVAVLVPREVVNARAGDQGGVGIVFRVSYACAVLGAFLDLIDPNVVDCAAAGVVELPRRIGVRNGLTIDHTGIVEPVHVLVANAGGEVGVLRDSVADLSAAELAPCFSILDGVVVAHVADALGRVVRRSCQPCYLSAVGHALVG